MSEYRVEYRVETQGLDGNYPIKQVESLSFEGEMDVVKIDPNLPQTSKSKYIIEHNIPIGRSRIYGTLIYRV